MKKRRLIFPVFIRSFGILILGLALTVAMGACSGTGMEMDSDEDGIADLKDNCPDYFNPHQTDDDQNSVGDLCEGIPEPLSCEQLLECNFSEDCRPFVDQIAAVCPNGQDFEVDSVACCDHLCAPLDAETFECPAGTCPTPGAHCQTDQDCPVEMPACMEGCCVDLGFICPSGIPPLECCPPEADCSGNEAVSPCPEGQVCDLDGCCMLEEQISS